MVKSESDRIPVKTVNSCFELNLLALTITMTMINRMKITITMGSTQPTLNADLAPHHFSNGLEECGDGRPENCPGEGSAVRNDTRTLWGSGGIPGWGLQVVVSSHLVGGVGCNFRQGRGSLVLVRIEYGLSHSIEFY